MSKDTEIEVLFVDAAMVGRIPCMKVVPYVVREHLAVSGKFLYWPARVMSTDHAVLAVGRLHESIVVHMMIHVEIERQFGHSDEEMRMPTGAGLISQGKVVSWSSTGFFLDTPRDLHRPILKALGIE